MRIAADVGVLAALDGALLLTGCEGEAFATQLRSGIEI